ncbi:MAG: bifunctional UDP-N-acetylglucosamine diphosphorylase/glucosamine-1-phosphate N-acetyltransferase GlmU [Ruminococcaceae bacterium]|nr:bifunctional UDP-N-acetylglucosamine diphosphorylase/glucosamine-1-phosphate N-acetyltransferase GlmU [Oscillospiraceae bacterium]
MKQFIAVMVTALNGSEMVSKQSKVLHEVCGKTMAEWVCDAALEAGAARVIPMVDALDEQTHSFLKERFSCVVQTGSFSDALADALGEFDGTVVVLSGDHPLLTAQTIGKVVSLHGEQAHQVTVCEEIGLYCFETADLQGSSADTLEKLVGCMRAAGKKVEECSAGMADEKIKVNNRADLAMAGMFMRRRINAALMGAGVTLVDPTTTYIDAGVEIASDTVIEPNVYLRGNTVIGTDCVIGNGTTIEDSVVGDGVHIKSSVILSSDIGEGTTVGPFAYIRPGSHIGAKVKIGDFVEVKNSTIGEGTKVSHLTYIGDSDVGRHINFGCGTITVNYDGKNKFRTVIEDNAFIGCNTNLVAPVTVHENAFIAAGSTITDDIEADALAIARSRQTVKPNWRKNK